MERAVILSEGPTIDANAILMTTPSPPPSVPTPGGPVVTFIEAERRAIVAALEAAQWRVSGPGGAAERLAVKPTTLHAKIKKLHVRRPVTRP